MPEPVNVKDIEWQSWRESDEIRFRYKPLHDAPKAHMGVCVQELAPGCSTRPAHYHMKEEEHLYVLSGAMTVRLGAEEFPLTVGSYVCFAAGDTKEHCLFNRTDAPCEYLLWGERKADEVVVYPDSKRVYVRSLNEVYRREPLDRGNDEL